MEVATDVGAVCYRAVDGGEGACEKLCAHRVVLVGETVFGDVYWLPIGLEIDERLVDGLGVEFPADIGAAFVWVFVEAVV